MSIANTRTFNLPEGWTVRKVATTMVHEWIAPLQAEPARKAARWVVQSVVDPDKTGGTLWEAGISTSEYEERLGRPDLCWAIRASAGRGKSAILARLAPSKDDPAAFELISSKVAFPETLFDPDKLNEFLTAQNVEAEDLCLALLVSHGFQPVS